MMKETFPITLTPEENFLLISFPNNPKLYTQARYFDEIEIMAKDVIYLMCDIPKDQIELNIESPIPQDFHKRISSFVGANLSTRCAHWCT
jgi:predicted RNase H-like HicB family nuclease